jgi:hypothetical protein
MIKEFEKYQRDTNLSENTIASYLFAIKQFKAQYDVINKENLWATNFG